MNEATCDALPICFSTFGEQNFREVAAVLSSGLDYRPFNTVKKLLADHFEIIYSEEETIPLCFDTPRAVLDHIKHTGTNALAKSRWTKGDLVSFEKSYQDSFACPEGVSLTYHPMYLIGRALRPVSPLAR